jgi:integrase
MKSAFRQEKTMTRRSFGHIRKLPSKRLQASYVSTYGRRVNAPYTFLTKADANAWLSAQETHLRRGDDPKLIEDSALATEAPVFEDFVSRHIELQTNSHGSLLKKSTKDLYKRLLRVNLKAFWGKRLDAINVADVNEWWASAIAGGKKTTASKAYKLLSASLKRAVEENLITANPCKVKGAHAASSGKQQQVPTLEEVKLLSKNINPRFSKMVLLLAFSGLRFGEMSELRRKDIHVSEVEGKRTYSLKIDRAVTLVYGEEAKKSHHVDLPKSTASIRNVIMPSSLTPLLDEIIAGLPKSKDALVFPAASSPNNHLRHDVFMNSWRRAAMKSGIPSGKYSPHGLRHFAGTHLHEAGATIPELKEWLGDSTTAAVMRYVHTTGRTAQIVDAMVSAEELL